jgi:hypothetical protein
VGLLKQFAEYLEFVAPNKAVCQADELAATLTQAAANQEEARSKCLTWTPLLNNVNLPTLRPTSR